MEAEMLRVIVAIAVTALLTCGAGVWAKSGVHGSSVGAPEICPTGPQITPPEEFEGPRLNY
jgi:hypothetical protein